MKPPPIERCPHCGVFYPVPAQQSHALDECHRNQQERPLPAREPSSEKRPNQPVRVIPG